MNRFFLVTLLIASLYACKSTDANPDLAVDLIGTYRITKSYPVPLYPGQDSVYYSTKEDQVIVVRSGTSLTKVEMTVSLMPYKYGKQYVQTKTIWLRVQDGKTNFFLSDSENAGRLGVWNNDDQLNMSSYSFGEGESLIGFKAVRE